HHVAQGDRRPRNVRQHDAQRLIRLEPANDVALAPDVRQRAGSFPPDWRGFGLGGRHQRNEDERQVLTGAIRALALADQRAPEQVLADERWSEIGVALTTIAPRENGFPWTEHLLVRPGRVRQQLRHAHLTAARIAAVMLRERTRQALAN